jgi:glucose/arabinose dehydrogenase
MTTSRLGLASATLVLSLSANAQNTYPGGWGPNPVLPAPERSLIPTLNVAPAEPWPKGTHPVPAPGLAVSAYASGLEHPRWVYVLPNGDVLVAETNKPPEEKEPTSIRGAVQKHEQKKAGAGAPSANRITLLRGVDANGAAATRSAFLEGLHGPFGMALVGNDLYIANADALWRFPYKTGDTRITAKGVKVMDLPAGINHHWTKNVVASPDGKKLYVSVGSNSNAGEAGMEAEKGRAAIWEYDIASGKSHIYATGLRNPVGMGFQPQTRQLWVSVNERDELGNELVPDYMTAVKEAPSTAGRTAITGSTSTTGSSRSGRSWSPRRFRPIMRSAITRRRSAWPFTTAACCRSTRTARWSASTARGTASPSPATSWSMCRSTMANPAGHRRKYSLVS